MIAAEDIDLEQLEQLDDAAVVERLTALRGIGRWTAEYVLLRGLGRLHVFPGDDVGAHNKLRRLFGIDTALDYDGVKLLVAPWQPYAGAVYFHLLLDSPIETGGPEPTKPRRRRRGDCDVERQPTDAADGLGAQTARGRRA